MPVVGLCLECFSRRALMGGISRTVSFLGNVPRVNVSTRLRTSVESCTTDSIYCPGHCGIHPHVCFVIVGATTTAVRSFGSGGTLHSSTPTRHRRGPIVLGLARRLTN